MSFNKVNPIPVVGVAPDSGTQVSVSFNPDWVEILVGLIEKANWSGFWEGTEEEVKAALSHVIQLAGLMVGSPCVGNQVCTIVERSTTVGGSSIAGWQVRTLNTIEGDPDWCTLSETGSKFTPDAGDYYIEITAPVLKSGTHILRLFNYTDYSVSLEGESHQVGTSYSVISRGTLAGFFTANGEDEYQVYHYTNSAKSSNGLGLAPAAGVNGVHTRVTLWRIRS